MIWQFKKSVTLNGKPYNPDCFGVELIYNSVVRLNFLLHDITLKKNKAFSKGQCQNVQFCHYFLPPFSK